MIRCHRRTHMNQHHALAGMERLRLTRMKGHHLTHMEGHPLTRTGERRIHTTLVRV